MVESPRWVRAAKKAWQAGGKSLRNSVIAVGAGLVAAIVLLTISLLSANSNRLPDEFADRCRSQSTYGEVGYMKVTEMEKGGYLAQAPVKVDGRVVGFLTCSLAYDPETGEEVFSAND